MHLHLANGNRAIDYAVLFRDYEVALTRMMYLAKYTYIDYLTSCTDHPIRSESYPPCNDDRHLRACQSRLPPVFERVLARHHS